MQDEIKELFKDRPEAFYFLCRYVEYVHAIDDAIDEEKSINNIRDLTRLGAQLFSCDYWLRYSKNLIIVERLIHNVYFDSVEWENSISGWKKRDAKVMNQRGYDMIFAIILIEFGEDKLKEFSLKFREYSHLNQGHDKC